MGYVKFCHLTLRSMVPVYQYLSQVSSLVFISTVVMLDVWILRIVKTVNIYRLDFYSLSRKLARSIFTNPYPIRVYNFK